jgi:hypothetical protein
MDQLQTCRSNSSSLLVSVQLSKAVSLRQSSAVAFLVVLVQQPSMVCSLLAELIQHMEHLQLQSNPLQMQLAVKALVQCLMPRELPAVTQLLHQSWALVHRQQAAHELQLQGPQASALELQQAWLAAAVSRLQQHSLLASASVPLLAVLLDSSVLHQAALLSPAPGQLTARQQLELKALPLPLGYRHPVQQVLQLQQARGWGCHSVHLQGLWGQGQDTALRLEPALVLQVGPACNHSARQLQQGPRQGGQA